MDVWSERCVLSGSLCDELITRPEESYCLWCIVVCELETSRMRRPWLTGGGLSRRKQTNKAVQKLQSTCQVHDSTLDKAARTAHRNCSDIVDLLLQIRSHTIYSWRADFFILYVQIQLGRHREQSVTLLSSSSCGDSYVITLSGRNAYFLALNPAANVATRRNFSITWILIVGLAAYRTLIMLHWQDIQDVAVKPGINVFISV